MSGAANFPLPSPGFLSRYAPALFLHLCRYIGITGYPISTIEYLAEHCPAGIEIERCVCAPMTQCPPQPLDAATICAV